MELLSERIYKMENNTMMNQKQNYFENNKLNNAIEHVIKNESFDPITVNE